MAGLRFRWRRPSRLERACLGVLALAVAVWAVGWYGLAKLAEAADHAIWDATNGLVAGHALKHLTAAAAGAAALGPLRAPTVPKAAIR